VTRALLLTALFSSSAFGLPPRTLESLRNDLARDFPPTSGTAYSIDPVAIGADGKVTTISPYFPPDSPPSP
jgi:hypothetical protein